MQMPLKNVNHIFGRLSLTGFILAFLFWLTETFAHYFFFDPAKDLLENLFPSDPNEFWMRLVAILLIIGFGFYTQNIITRLRTTKEDLLRSERHYRREKELAETYFEMAGVIFLVLKPDGTVASINKKGCEVLGCDEGRVKGINWFENYIPDEKREESRECFRGLFSGERGFEYAECAVITKGGSERVVAWHNALLRDSSGNIVAAISSGEDITDRKTAEEALRERVDELERFRKATVEREFRIKELKDQVAALEKLLGRKAS